MPGRHSRWVSHPVVRGSREVKAAGPLRHVPANAYHKYALQLSLYSLMLEETHGVRCQGGLFLMRMHAAYETYEVVSCRDMRDEARAVLEVEGQRILAERHKLSG